MSSCSMCGSALPSDQGSNTCSMCYGDPDHGKDGYYNDWINSQYEDYLNKQQEQEQQEKEQHEDN